MQMRQMRQHPQRGQLDPDSHPSDEVELQPAPDQPAHGSRSALYSSLVCFTADHTSITAIPTIPLAPPISKIRYSRPSTFPIGPCKYTAILPIQSKMRSSVGPKLQN